MIIAHLPAGYIAGRVLTDYLEITVSAQIRYRMLVTCLIGSVFPDIDWFYCGMIDHFQRHHHSYWTHIPIFWLAAVFATSGAACLANSRTFGLISCAFIAGVFLHLILDTPFGDIAWLYPFSDRYIHLIRIPRRDGWWVWNFVLHGSFLTELVICLAAGVLYRNRKPETSQLHSTGNSMP